MTYHNQQDNVSEEYVFVTLEVIREFVEEIDWLLDNLNNIGENESEENNGDKKHTIDRLKDAYADLEEIRSEIEEYFNEGFCPWGD